MPKLSAHNTSATPGVNVKCFAAAYLRQNEERRKKSSRAPAIKQIPPQLGARTALPAGYDAVNQELADKAVNTCQGKDHVPIH